MTLPADAIVLRWPLHCDYQSWTSDDLVQVKCSKPSDVVDPTVLDADGRPLVAHIGADANEWVQKIKLSGWGVDHLATSLDINSERPLSKCQNVECQSSKSRQGAGGDLENYKGALYCEDCMD